MHQLYVTAMIKSINSGVDVELVLSRTNAIMSERGHAGLWSQVLTNLLTQLELTAEQKKPTVTMSKPDSVTPATIAAKLAELKLPADYIVNYDDSLIGGMVIKHDHHIYDSSYKQQLLELYQNITNTTPATK